MPAMAGQKKQSSISLISPLFCFSLQGRHVKTGQLAAIKVMDVTEVSKRHCGFKSLQKNRVLKYSVSWFLCEPRTDIREVGNLTATSSSPKAWSSWHNFGSRSMVIRCPDTLKRNEHFIKAATENPLIWVDQIVPSVFKDPADFSWYCTNRAKHVTPPFHVIVTLCSKIRQKQDFTLNALKTKKKLN